jgi:hypothetical protein
MPHFNKLKRRSHKIFSLEEELELKEMRFRSSNKSSFSEIPYENLYEKLQRSGVEAQLSDTITSGIQDGDKTSSNVIHSIGQPMGPMPTFKNNFTKGRNTANYSRKSSGGREYKETFYEYERSPDRSNIKTLKSKATPNMKNKIKTGKLSALWPNKKAKGKEISIHGGPCAFSKSPVRSPIRSRTNRNYKLGGEKRALSIEPGIPPSSDTNFFSTLDLNEARITPPNVQITTKSHYKSLSPAPDPEPKSKPVDTVRIFTNNFTSLRHSTEKLTREVGGFFCLDKSINIRGRSISPSVTSRDIVIPIPAPVLTPTPHLDNLDLDSTHINPPVTTVEACNQVSLQCSSRNQHISMNSIDIHKDDGMYSLDKVMISVKPKSQNRRYSINKQNVNSPLISYKPSKISMDNTRLLQNLKEERPKSGKMYGKIVKGRSFVFTSEDKKYPMLKIVSKSISE